MLLRRRRGNYVCSFITELLKTARIFLIVLSCFSSISTMPLSASLIVSHILAQLRGLKHVCSFGPHLNKSTESLDALALLHYASADQLCIRNLD